MIYGKVFKNLQPAEQPAAEFSDVVLGWYTFKAEFGFVYHPIFATVGL